MNGYERARKALTFQQIDCVPTFGGWIVSPDFFEYITGKDFWQDPVSIACQAYRKLEVDIVFQCFYLPPSKDEWRIALEEPELKEQENYKSPEDIINWIDTLPEPQTLAREHDFEKEFNSELKKFEDFQEKLGSDILCIPEGSCARFTWYIKFGYEHYLVALALYPDKMKKLFRYSAETARLKNTVLAELVKQDRIPPFFFQGDDICGNRGPIISPQMLRKLYFPCLKYSLEPLVNVGADIIWHSDGYFLPIIDDLINCGASGFQGFQTSTGYSVADIASKKVRSGRRPLLFAGLEVNKVLCFGTIDDVKKEINNIVSQVDDLAGLIIGTANTAGPDCPNENLETLYTYAHKIKNKSKIQ